MVEIKYFIVSIFILMFSGCVSKKEIKLKSISIISKQEVKKSYLTQKYVTPTKYNGCAINLNDIYNKPDKISDKFLKIVFLSKDKVFYSYDESHKEKIGYQPPYIHFFSDNIKLINFGLCPLRDIQNGEYINTIYYPIAFEDRINGKIDKEYDLKKINKFLFYLRTVDYFRWKSNEIVITKDMIDKLNF